MTRRICTKCKREEPTYIYDPTCNVRGYCYFVEPNNKLPFRSAQPFINYTMKQEEIDALFQFSKAVDASENRPAFLLAMLQAVTEELQKQGIGRSETCRFVLADP